jgi:hypothetical protein
MSGPRGALDAWVARAARGLRVAVAETWHPDGAMVGWLSGSAHPGRLEVLSVPTQEVLGLVGPDGLRAAWRAIAREFRPDLVLVHPPYDLLDAATVRAIQEAGARVIAHAFDEPLFAAARQDPALQPRFAEAAARFDAYLVTGIADVTSLASLGVSAAHLRFATSLAPFEVRAQLPAITTPAGVPLSRAAVLVGRAYPRRQALVATLAGAGVPIIVFGRGWEEATRSTDAPSPIGVGPPLSRAAMNAVLAEAGAVLTTGDWEEQQLPMVKYRLLEAAMLGGPQAVQAAPGLSDYFRSDEVIAWSTPETCADVVRALLADPVAAREMAARARARVLDEHLADARLGELLERLGDAAPAPRAIQGAGHGAGPSPSDAWAVLGALVAHDAERLGDLTLAEAAFARLFAATGSPDALAGLHRVALAGDGLPAAGCEGPVVPAALAADSTAAVGLHLDASGLNGPGLGRLGHLDPTAERLATAFALAPATALIEAARARAADTVIAMAAMLEVPAEQGLAAKERLAWSALVSAALEAQPGLLGATQAAHRPRWEAALAALTQAAEGVSRP